MVFAVDSKPSLPPNKHEHYFPARSSANVANKLQLLNDRFNSIEREMEVETKQRLDGETSRIESVRSSMAKLEKTLNSEIKRRIEANKALQGIFETQIISVQEKLEGVFAERFDRLNRNVESIGERLSALEKDFISEREKYVREIEDKNASVARDVSSLHAALDADRVSRQERESAIARRLCDLEYRTEGKLDEEKKCRENKLHELGEAISDCRRLREQGDEKFQSFMVQEIAALKDGLVVESQQREQSDDDIVQALNHYTRALQDAMRIVNSTA